MGLTKEEKKEINYDKLSEELKQKIDAAFSSPYFSTALAIYIQKDALETEMSDTPFTIRGEISLEVSEEGIKKAIAEAVTARQNTETALKVAKWLQEAAGILEKIQEKLLPAEKAELQSTIEKKKKEKYSSNGQVAI